MLAHKAEDEGIICVEHLAGKGTGGATITPHKWPSITPNTPLFGRAMDLYNAHHSRIFGKKKRKSLENLGKFLKIGENHGIWSNSLRRIVVKLPRTNFFPRVR